MAWKKDLAKLKQELVKEDPSPAKAPPPAKVLPKTPVSMSIEEEDAIFLSAMGLRPQQPRAVEAAPPQPQPAPPPLVRVEPKTEGPTTGEFSSAMGDLKGMKSLRRNPVETKAAKPKTATPAPAPVEPAPAPVEPAPAPPVKVEAEAPAATARIVPPAEPKAEAPPAGALEIHLAAGMAIEVDGGLDLRGHARTDGEERLKERILDGYNLGWRTLQVNLGASPELKEMLLALVKSPEGRCVARYAQAPIPMGGAQAWILYFRALPPAAADNP
jgi:hypothetical protein